MIWLARVVPWAPLAAAAYAATAGIGVLSLRGYRIRRVWHVRLFVVTFSLTLLAVMAGFVTAALLQGAILALALVPLSALPFVMKPTRTKATGHSLTAGAAAPCYAAAIAIPWVLV